MGLMVLSSHDEEIRLILLHGLNKLLGSLDNLKEIQRFKV